MDTNTLFAFLLWVCLPASTMAQTAEEIVSRYIEAAGGVNAFEQVKTKAMEFELLPEGGDPVLALSIWQRPDQYYDKMTYSNGNIITRVILNDKAQLKASGECQDLREDVVQDMRLNEFDIDGPLLNYKRKGHSIEFIGNEALNGVDAFKVKLTLKNNAEQILWFDKRTFLLIKLKRTVIHPSGPVELVREFSDFHDVHGVLYPFVYKSTFGPTSYTTQVKSIKINEAVDLSHF